MKPLKYFLLPFLLVFLACSDDDEATPPTDNTRNNAQQLLNAALEDFPGLSLTVLSGNENYTLVAGYANINNTPMAAGSLHYMQSIAKTYTATAILKLKEQGLIDLNAPISSYLPDIVVEDITNGNAITVRQLLTMTSGIADYLDNPQFINDVQAGNVPMTSEQILSYVYNKPAMFAPGEGAYYSNINYHLLAVIIDNVTGQHHYNYINDILSSNGLTSTFYLPGSGLTSAPAGTTASYMTSGNQYEDISLLQFAITLSLPGDDGLIASTQDVSKFYKKLLKDRSILSATSLDIMTTPVIVAGEPFYGMGLTYYTSPGGIEAIGHSGSGAGAASEAWYFPDRDIILVLTTNTGTLLDTAKEQKFRLLLNSLSGVLVDQ